MRKKSTNKTNLKFHALGLSLVIGVVLILFMLLGPSKHSGPVTEVVGDRHIVIDHATWGHNCDPYVDQAIVTWRPAAQGAVATPKPTRAQSNNALTPVSDACNGKLTCELPVDSETLKVDPLPSCFKRLDVGYRCFNYDRLTLADIGQGEMLKIDCHEKSAAPVTGTKAQ